MSAVTILKAAPSRLRQQEFVQTVWSYVAETGTTVEDLLRPDFWSTIAGPGARLRRMDKVCVVLDDESFYAELLILSVGTGWAKMAVISKVDLEAQSEADETAPFYVKWGGPHLKWTVIRRKDSERVKEKLEAKAEAEQWARDHTSAMAA